MSVREVINKLPRGIVIGVVIVAAGAAAFVGYRAMDASAGGVDRSIAMPAMTTCRCSNCGHRFTAETAALIREKKLDAFEGLMLMGDGRNCPNCGQPTLSVVEAEEAPAR